MARTIWRGDEVMRNVRRQETARLARSLQAGYDASQEECPVKSGFLQRSGAWAVYDNGQLVAGMQQDNNGHALPAPPAAGVHGLIVYNAPYSAAVLFGTHGRPGNPWLITGAQAAQRVFG
jgi:hypothetical protein